MFNVQPRSRNYFRLWGLILVLVFSCPLFGCNDRLVASPPPSLISDAKPVAVGKLAEVSPPPIIQQLRRGLEQYQPQVKILSPQPEQVLEDTTVSVKLSVQDLTIFQNPDLEMGPHLHLILDNEPYQAVYKIDQPIILNNLTPGTHSLRVFASRPWHESFKNDGAFAQTIFHVLTKTEDNRPDPDLPLLTYSRPKGSYGAEPILLDFYLTNAPLHLIAQENPKDAIADWRIRVTINNESFILDNWQPIYLTGFEKGQNWVKLEFIDKKGNLVQNAFNNTVRVIDYAPQGQDTLSQLVRGELSLEVANSIINPHISVPQKVEPPTPSLPLVVEEEPVPIAKPTDAIKESPVSAELPPVVTESEEPEAEIFLPSQPPSQDSSVPLISPQSKETLLPHPAMESPSFMTEMTETAKGASHSEPEPIPSPINSLQTERNPLVEIPADLEKTTHNP